MCFSVAARGNVELVSICAGVKLCDLSGFGCPVIRVMPNLPVRVGAGAMPYSCSADCPVEFEEKVLSLFKPVGLIVKVDEKLFNCAQGISGCGPAFVALFVESLVDAGVREGLSREVASKLAAHTIYGTGKLLAESECTPAELKYKVCSPGGVTIAGVASLEENSFRATVMRAHRSTMDQTARMEAKAGVSK